MERSKIGLLLAKIESTYGTDPTPTAAANVIATTRGEVTWAPEFDPVSREILDGGLGSILGDNALPRVKLNFRVEIRGNRTNGTAADISSGSNSNPIEIDALLQGCDLTPTYTAESAALARDGYVTYKPAVPVDQGKGVTFYFYSGLKLHKVIGAKGTVKGSLEAGKYGSLDFEFMGLYAAVTDASIPSAPTFLDTKPALFINSGSSYDAWSGAVFTKLDFDLANVITRRDDAQATDGVRGFLITDRAPKASLDPESIAEATHPIWADLKTAKIKTLIGKIGSATGNRMDVTLSTRQRSVAYADRNGNRIQNVQLDVQRSALSTTIGNEFQLKFY